MKFQNILPLLEDQQGTASQKFLRFFSGLYIFMSAIAGLLAMIVAFRAEGIEMAADVLMAAAVLVQGFVVGGAGLCLATISENVLAKRVIAQGLARKNDGAEPMQKETCG